MDTSSTPSLAIPMAGGGVGVWGGGRRNGMCSKYTISLGQADCSRPHGRSRSGDSSVCGEPHGAPGDVARYLLNVCEEAA